MDIYKKIIKAFAEDNSDVAKMTISVFDLKENIVGKERKCLFTSIFSIQHCLTLFQTSPCFNASAVQVL